MKGDAPRSNRTRGNGRHSPALRRGADRFARGPHALLHFAALRYVPACLWAGISRIVYGAGREDVHSVYFDRDTSDTFDFIRDAFSSDLEIEGVLAEQCATFYDAPRSRSRKKTIRPTGAPNLRIKFITLFMCKNRWTECRSRAFLPSGSDHVHRP